MSMDKKKSVSKATWIGAIVLFLSPLLVGISGLADVIHGGSFMLGEVKVGYGIRGCIDNYWKMWDPSQYPHVSGFLGALLIVFAVICLVFEAVVIIKKKEPKLLFNAVARFLGIAFLPYLILLVVTLLLAKQMTTGAMIVLIVSLFLDLIGSAILMLPYRDLAKDEAACSLAKTSEKEEKEEAPTLSETDVRRIVDDRLAKLEGEYVNEERAKAIADKEIVIHQEEFHAQKEEAEESLEQEVEPEVEVKEEPKKEEPVEEEKPVKEDAVQISTAAGTADDPFAALGKHRRAKFETRLKNADPELRAKYYELRDYIRSYGIKDRISIPGHTFSLHRERYAFLTVSGKKLKVFFALNPDDYANTTIPVIRNESKKFEDLPLEFKIKSDLSLKRAKALVDDVMKAKGIEKPEESK